MGGKGTVLTERTIFARHLARRTTAFVGHATDPADVAFVVWVGVPGVPAPLGDGAPVFDVDFHRGACGRGDARIALDICKVHGFVRQSVFDACLRLWTRLYCSSRDRPIEVCLKARRYGTRDVRVVTLVVPSTHPWRLWRQDVGCTTQTCRTVNIISVTRRCPRIQSVQKKYMRRNERGQKLQLVVVTYTTSVHRCRICASLDRGSNTTLNGSAIWFAVSEKSNELIGDLGSSDRRNAQKTSAAFTKIERFATCCPGQILRREG